MQSMLSSFFFSPGVVSLITLATVNSLLALVINVQNRLSIPLQLILGCP